METIMANKQLIKNNVFYGLIIGIVLPILVFALLYAVNRVLITNELSRISFKLSSVALFSICANLLPVLVANKQMMEEFIRGMMFPTVLGAFAWFFYFDPVGLFN
jgi:hypothetical protein